MGSTWDEDLLVQFMHHELWHKKDYRHTRETGIKTMLVGFEDGLIMIE
jgi:hypothetical protein